MYNVSTTRQNKCKRTTSINFQTATAAKLEGVKDAEVLAIAAQQQRILISQGILDNLRWTIVMLKPLFSEYN